MKVKERVRSMFIRPEKKLYELNSELLDLRNTLHGLSSKNSLNAIVEFFNVVSKWHDKGINDLIREFKSVNYGQKKYEKIIGKLCALNLHFEKAGRNEFGFNRTKYGETVTDNNVFLGGIFGLNTHSVSFWEMRKNGNRGGWGFAHMEKFNSHDVISWQASNFLNDHLPPIIKIIDELQVVMA